MNHKRGAGVRAAAWAAICAAIWLGTIAASSAQTYQGGLRGQVRDQQGVIPGAEVVLTNEETGSARTVVSNDVGEYGFPSVLPGTYHVSVSLPGFKTGERNGLRIGTQQTVVADFTLEIGAISEQISIGTMEEMEQSIPVFMAVLGAPPVRQTASLDRLDRLPNELT